MKKTLLLLLSCFLSASLGCIAQDYSTYEEDTSVKSLRPTPRRKYINLSYTSSTLKQNGGELKSEYGAAFTLGRTFFLHKRPIGGVLRFGLDATWLDLNFTNYKSAYLPESPDYDDDYGYHYSRGPETIDLYDAEISMHIGPSININPVGKLNISTYFRYAPTFSCIYDGQDYLIGNYASFFVGGASISYGAIGVGVEARIGDAKYKALRGEAYSIEEAYGISLSDKIKHSGFRAYITFRFGAKKPKN